MLFQVDGGVNDTHAKWGEGFLLVYSLTDRTSFLAVPDIFASIASVRQSQTFPCAIVANKIDLSKYFDYLRLFILKNRIRLIFL